MRIKESQSAIIEAKLKRIARLQTQSQEENKRVKNIPHGTKVIRLRKGSSEKHITQDTQAGNTLIYDYEFDGSEELLQ